MSTNNKTLNLLSDLVKYKSITPDVTECQKYIEDYLAAISFRTEYVKYEDVQNMIATYGEGSPCLAFIGHTDVVPPGDLSKWKSDPYCLQQDNGMLIGRGTADMKGGIACFMSAVREFLEDGNAVKGSIKFILTADEEGDAVNGIRKIVDQDIFKDNDLDYCLVGEPSSSTEIGDVIRNGRRGSITGHLTLHGVQGHVAYPEKADNPIHSCSEVLSNLLRIKFDNGNEFFPPTSFQVSNINAGTGVDNVIPGDIKLSFNVRYSTETNADKIKNSIIDVIESSNVKYDISWKHSGEPFLTTDNEFMNMCKESIKDVTSIDTVVSTNGGTSDGRFMAKICEQVIELGLTNRSIHKINESVKEEDLEILKNIYKKILARVFSN
ncbi:MAG: succinyl-diaminopimelate desuccinylase [Pseudomonadota bacterium]|nr:succinyl-diaminopimelate desuccinylase [Pseudomonadota bacterium]